MMNMLNLLRLFLIPRRSHMPIAERQIQLQHVRFNLNTVIHPLPLLLIFTLSGNHQTVERTRWKQKHPEVAAVDGGHVF